VSIKCAEKGGEIEQFEQGGETKADLAGEAQEPVVVVFVFGAFASKDKRNKEPSGPQDYSGACEADAQLHVLIEGDASAIHGNEPSSH